ncbi:MAG TPA: ribosome maturation factor RimP [Micromonosporaceae bacterium]
MAQRERGAAASARSGASRANERQRGTGARSSASGRDRRSDQAQRSGHTQRPGPEYRVDLGPVRARLTAVIEPALAEIGLDLEELSVTRVGRRHLVRVVVDADGGVGHDELTDASRDIVTALDDAEQAAGSLFAGPGVGGAADSGDDAYTLEISSPGVDRPLTLPRHWRRNLGRLVKVKAGGALLTARVMAADDDQVSLDAGGNVQKFRYDELGAGRVQVEFTRLADLTDEDFGPEIVDSEGDDGVDAEADEDDDAEYDDAEDDNTDEDGTDEDEQDDEYDETEYDEEQADGGGSGGNHAKEDGA